MLKSQRVILPYWLNNINSIIKVCNLLQIMTRSVELDKWLDEWSSKIDELEAEGKDVLDFDLFQKYASFMVKFQSFITRNFRINE